MCYNRILDLDFSSFIVSCEFSDCNLAIYTCFLYLSSRIKSKYSSKKVLTLYRTEE